jgi:hypothetical protein
MHTRTQGWLKNLTTSGRNTVLTAQLTFIDKCKAGDCETPTSMLAALVHYVFSGAVRRFRAFSATPESIDIKDLHSRPIDLGEVFSPLGENEFDALVDRLNSGFAMKSYGKEEFVEIQKLNRDMQRWCDGRPLPGDLIRGLLKDGHRLSHAWIAGLCEESKIALRILTVSEGGNVLFNAEFNTKIWGDGNSKSMYLIVKQEFPAQSSSLSSSRSSSSSSSSLSTALSSSSSSSSSAQSMLTPSSGSMLFGASLSLHFVENIDPKLMDSVRRSQKSEQRRDHKLYHAAMFNIFNNCQAQLSLAELVTRAFAFVTLAAAEYFGWDKPLDADAFAARMKKAYFPVTTELQDADLTVQNRYKSFNNYNDKRSFAHIKKKVAMLDEFEDHAEPWVDIWKESYDTFQDDDALRSRLQLIIQRQWDRLHGRMHHLQVAEIPTLEQLKVHAKHVVDTTALRMINGKTAINTPVEVHGMPMDYGRPENDREHVLSNSFLVPENCIFVGSQMLSRGLTIEGLCTSYYPKAVTLETQDTSQQCCRWYGHRPDYSDLVSLFVQQRQSDLFRCLTISESMLRQDIKAFILAGKAPPDPLPLRTANNFSKGISLFRPTGPGRMRHSMEIPRGQDYAAFTALPSKEACNATESLYSFAIENSSSTKFFGAVDIHPSCEVFYTVDNEFVANYLELLGGVPSNVCTHIRDNENTVNLAFLGGGRPPLIGPGPRQNSFVGDRNALLDIPSQKDGRKVIVAEGEARAWFKFVPLGRQQLTMRPNEADDSDYSRPETLYREQDAPTLVTILRHRGYEGASLEVPYQVELLISTISTIDGYLPPEPQEDIEEEEEEEEMPGDEVIDDGEYIYVDQAVSHKTIYLLDTYASLPKKEGQMIDDVIRDMLLDMFNGIRENPGDVSVVVYLLGENVTPENEDVLAWPGYLELLKNHGRRSVSIASMYQGLINSEFKTVYDFLVLNHTHT